MTLPSPTEIRRVTHEARLLGVDVALLRLAQETEPMIHTIASADGEQDALVILSRMNGLVAMAQRTFKTMPPSIQRATIELMRSAKVDGFTIVMAYAADMAESEGKVFPGTEGAPMVKAALRRHRRRGKDHDLRLLVKLFMTQHWVDEDLCDMTESQLAGFINYRFHANFTPAAIKKLRQRLGLITIRNRGRKPSE